jgi:hypothetical protein
LQNLLATGSSATASFALSTMDLSFAVGVELPLAVPLAEGVDEDEEGADFESHAARSTRTSNDVKSFMCAVYHVGTVLVRVGT